MANGEVFIKCRIGYCIYQVWFVAVDNPVSSLDREATISWLVWTSLKKFAVRKWWGMFQLMELCC